MVRKTHPTLLIRPIAHLHEVPADGEGLAQKFPDAVIGADLGAEDDGPGFFDIREAFFVQDVLIGLDVQDLPDEQGVEADFQGVDQLALQDQGEFRDKRGVHQGRWPPE